MTSVWVVTTGTYSDYRIKRIFSTKELAERYVATIDNPDVDVEGWDLDESFDPDSVYWEIVFVEDTGRVWAAHRYEEGVPDGRTVNDFQRTSSKYYDGRGFRWAGVVQARTKEHAIKIASERLVMALARENGMG